MSDPMPAVLGIDPSQTAAGIAAIAGGPRHINWPVLIRDVGEDGHRADPWTKRARRIVAQTKRVMAVINDAETTLGLRYHLAVVEGPAYGNKLPSQYDRAGVFWGIVAALDAKRIPVAIVPPATRAMFATGKGRAEKALVLAETRSLWRASGDPGLFEAINNDNQADALTLATMGVMNLRWTLPIGPPQRRHVENVAKCGWPKVVEVE